MRRYARQGWPLHGRVRAVDLQAKAVRSFRRAARHSPAVYNLRTRHNALVQRARGGVHDVDFEVLRNLDMDAPMVVDVGANTGQTLQTVKTIRPNSRMICIEPSALVLASLVTQSKKYDGVEVATFAVGDEFGTARISTPVARGIYFTQYASLTNPDDVWFARLLTHAGFGPLRPEDVSFHQARCVIAPIDAVVDSCDVLKVDAEGYEDAVFRGATRLVMKSQPIVIVERPSHDLVAQLTSAGYQVLRSSGSVNTVFVHADNPRGLLRKT